ncbi:MAG: hypothetical protein UR60_C0001G0026 [Candidatus Moranbacteria bacterium GW2011_GWF2_34_56]|nr:MAG: hypothetical protein UR51_C0002G0021 [Candidatus Moranbacteria bacterium GW2011_GWF1_34_10]KKP65419.1 MAG: hypothetical protein UR60_C0001G0026 [Candidatus Moranbacteria bacterium GW2011_GWF2_34_56]
MSLKAYIWSLIFITFLALGAWLFVLFNIDPYESGIIGQIFFYLSFWIFLMGFWMNILLWLRIKFLGGETAIETMSLTFRQSFLLALMIILIIVLNAYGYFTWWIGLLVVAGIFLAELCFLSRE